MKAETLLFTRKIIELALEEDLGRGDITTQWSVDPNVSSKGYVIAKQDLVVSGMDVFVEVMSQVDCNTAVEVFAFDGKFVKKGETMAVVQGKTASLLMAERVSLNFLQRLCGIATLTKQFCDQLPPNSKTKLVDTRKTTPGMRFLEKMAVLHGGGKNHRADLGSGILIKENHVASAGNIKNAVKKCKEGAPHTLRIEIEVRNENELKSALDAGVDIVMLDNMTNEEIIRCLKIIDKKTITEASGGVTLSSVGAIAATGVDIISVGAFTHSAPAVDISFLIDGAI